MSGALPTIPKVGTSPRLTAVEIHTTEVETVAAFYRDIIGVPIAPGDDAATHYEASWGEWGGEGFFFFAIQPVGKAGAITTGAEIGFEVDDLAAAHARAVDAGATVVDPPSERPWGSAAVYADPAGNLVELTQG